MTEPGSEGVTVDRRTILAGISAALAATGAEARAEFEEAWQVFLANRTEADFQEWRAAFTGWKYRMWDTRHRLPTQTTDRRPVDLFLRRAIDGRQRAGSRPVLSRLTSAAPP
jgi:hypothetical protein